MVKKNNPDSTISLTGTIDLYKRLIEEGRIKKNGAGARRLEKLQRRLFAYRKWIKLPHAKRRHITSPI